MKFKKNLTEVIERNKKFWNGNYRDKVLAKIDVDGLSTMRMWEKALDPKYCPDFKKMFDVFLDNFKKRKYLLDDATPTARPNIGDYAFGGYIGAEVVFGQSGGYAKPLLKKLEDVKKLKIDLCNYWVKELIKATKYFAEKSEELCATSIIETMDSLNFAENIYGSNVYYEINDHPKKLLEIFDFAYQFNIEIIEEQRKYIKKFQGGYFDIHEEWLPEDYIWLSIDAWGNCSIDTFKKLGRYHLQKIIDYFGCGWLHMHNSHLHLLEEIVSLRNLTGIGILDDPNQKKSFYRLKEIKLITKNIPLQINCSREDLMESIKLGTLERNVMYWVDSGVSSVEEGNKIMKLVYDY